MKNKTLSFIISLLALCAISQQAFAAGDPRIQTISDIYSTDLNTISVQPEMYLFGGRTSMGSGDQTVKSNWGFSGGLGVELGYTGILKKKQLPLFPTITLAWIAQHPKYESLAGSSNFLNHFDLFAGAKFSLFRFFELSAQIGPSYYLNSTTIGSVTEKSSGLGWGLDINMGHSSWTLSDGISIGAHLHYHHTFYYPEDSSFSHLNLGADLHLSWY